MIDNQKPLWDKINKRCETLGLTCQYDFDVCLDRYVVEDLEVTEAADQKKISLKWKNTEGNKYEVVQFKYNGAAAEFKRVVRSEGGKYITENWSEFISAYSSTESTVLPFECTADSCEIKDLVVQAPDAGSRIEYYVTADAGCKFGSDGAVKPYVGKTVYAKAQEKWGWGDAAWKAADASWKKDIHARFGSPATVCPVTGGALTINSLTIADSSATMTLASPSEAETLGDAGSVKYWIETFAVDNAGGSGNFGDASPAVAEDNTIVKAMAVEGGV